MSAVPSPRAAPTDAELISRIATGEIGGLGTLFDRYEADIKRFIGSLGVLRADVDDLVQQTFLTVVRAGATFDGRSSARNWLFGIASMVVRRHRRSLYRVARALAAWAAAPQDAPEEPSEAFEVHESADRAQRALSRLSAKKREVFVLVVLGGLSGEDAARALGIPIATVWTRLYHARRELRATLFGRRQ